MSFNIIFVKLIELTAKLPPFLSPCSFALLSFCSAALRPVSPLLLPPDSLPLLLSFEFLPSWFELPLLLPLLLPLFLFSLSFSLALPLLLFSFEFLLLLLLSLLAPLSWLPLLPLPSSLLFDWLELSPPLSSLLLLSFPWFEFLLPPLLLLELLAALLLALALLALPESTVCLFDPSLRWSFDLLLESSASWLALWSLLRFDDSLGASPF